MIYIHQLKDLNIKTANIESVPIIRKLKERDISSLTEEQILGMLGSYFISQKEIDLMINSSKIIPQTIERIKRIAQKNNPIYESINLHRGIASLEEVNQPLINNITYARDVLSWYDALIKEMSQSLNNLSILGGMDHAKTKEEKLELNRKFNVIFQRMLRNDNFAFNADDIVNEGKVARMKDMHSSLLSGFFFHVTVKEHLDKVDFETIKKRIPELDLSYANDITKEVFDIKQGIEKAYELNMNMINITVILFSYIKWLTK